MSAVTPCRTLVSERFPVASFVVDVPPDRCFELACATDPALFHPAQRARRTPRNFWTSRLGGLLRAPAGRATYLLPPEQLRNFAGAQRLYYALGTYGGTGGDQAQFSIDATRLERTPSIQLAGDFTGRSLDRRRLGMVVDGRYGRKQGDLTWGGDLHLVPPARSAGSAGALPASAQMVWRGVALEAGPTSATQPEPPSPSVSSAVHDDAPVAAEPQGWEHPDELPTIGHATVDLHDELGEPYGRRMPVAARGSQPPLRRGSVVLRDVAAGGPITRRTAYGRRGGALGGETTTDEADQLGAHASDFSDDEADADAALSVGMALDAPTLDLEAKFRIVQAVAAFESGLRPGDLDDPTRRAAAYGAINPNTDGAGLSWGLVQFTQKGGALGDVLQHCLARDEARFRAVFGSDADALLATCTAGTETARMAMVAGANLWQEPWRARFTAAGAEPAFQAAQNQVAIERYFDPNLGLAQALDFTTERGLAMVYDRCIQQGNSGAPRWLMQVAGPIRDPSAQVPLVLQALGFSDLSAFQRSVRGLVVDGRFGTRSHIALAIALRNLGTASPIPLADRAALYEAVTTAATREAADADAAVTARQAELDALPAGAATRASAEKNLAAARGARLWKRARATRLAALHSSTALGDTVFSWT